MDRIYESNAAASPPSPPGSPSSGYPAAGDPANGIPATRPGAYWYHQISEEIMNVIVAAGLTPDHTDLTQLREAVKVLVGVNPPVGSIIAWTNSTPPANYLECNGAAVSRTAYANLFNVIGTTFGAGDGSTTFNLPDLRGEFIRGWDNGRGVDASRALGSAQAEDVGPHTHAVVGLYKGFGTDGNSNYVSGGVSSGGYSTDSGSGSETRPRNIALLFAIKYQ